MKGKKETNTDSLFLSRIIDGDFFAQEHSEEQDYILVIRHCLSHTDETYDETLSEGLSRMLRKYPQKIEGLRKALKRLSPRQKEKANYEWDRLIWILYDKNYIMQEAWEWHVEDYKMAFENKKRLSPEDYRKGHCLYHR